MSPRGVFTVRSMNCFSVTWRRFHYASLSLMFLFQPKEQRRKTQKLSVWNKLCYAFGGAPYQITGSALGFFLQIYLLDVAQVIKICFLKKGKLNKNQQRGCRIFTSSYQWFFSVAEYTDYLGEQSLCWLSLTVSVVLYSVSRMNLGSCCQLCCRINLFHCSQWELMLGPCSSKHDLIAASAFVLLCSFFFGTILFAAGSFLRLHHPVCWSGLGCHHRPNCGVLGEPE